MREGLDHENTSEIVCPYCGHKFRDSWEHGEGEAIGLIDCEACDKSFYATRNISISYFTEKATYGACNNCREEGVVIEDYVSSIGNYNGLCQKCGSKEKKRMQQAYFDSLNEK